jgi:DNA-binding transcriptional MerR regulator
MKIKEVCSETKLTERTIRFYIEKGLIKPKSYELNGRTFYDYCQEDVRELMEIAALRKVGFTIESIIQMKDNPDKIDTILDTQYFILKENAKETLEIIKILEQVKGEHYEDVKELAESLQNPVSDISLPPMDIEPDFSKFESVTREEREEGYLDFRINQRIRERREAFFKPIRKIALTGLLLSGIFLLMIFISGVPRRVEKKYTGVQFYINSEGSIENTDIKVSGKLYKRWFSNPVFKGNIEIDNLDYTKNKIVELEMRRENGGWLTYNMIDNRGGEVIPVIKSAAIVWMKDNFEQVVFQLYIPKGDDSGIYADLVLCAPANNRSEGMKILNDLGLVEKLKRFNTGD